MFEQSIYEPEIVAPPVAEGDFLYNYEVNTWWKPSPQFYKILGLSALGNIIAILIVGQTSLLTMKGCDSPLVGNVCQALDAVYVGSMLLTGTDRAYVDAQYEKTKIGDNEEVTFVDVTGETPPLSYPEGYFQLANPDQFAMVEQQYGLNDQFGNSTFPNTTPGVPLPTPSTTGNSILDTPAVLPTPNKSVVKGPLPTFNSGTGTKSGSHITARTPEELDAAATAKLKPSPTPAASPLPSPMTEIAVNAVEINKKPLADFADQVAAQWDAKQVDLNQPFTVTLNGVITKDGKLDRDKSKFDATKQKGDAKMIDVAKSALEALGDSGYLTYLKALGVDKISAVLTQDDNQISVVITSTEKTPEMAKTVASGLSFAILVGKGKVENPSDERALLDGAKVTSDGKNFILNFSIPKPIAQEMITRKLKEAQAKKTQGQPSGNTNTRSSDNIAKQN